jgi:metal-responsive CopG/Arc/MetJ family transcriptional regulator
MRIRASLILEESLLAKIDEIAGEKHRRAAVIETALREYIAREERKARSKPAPAAIEKTATSGRRNANGANTRHS